MLGSSWRRLTGPFREFGILIGTAYIVSRTLPVLSPRAGLLLYELMAQPITDEPLIPKRMMRFLDIREVTRGDSVLEKMPVTEGVLEQRFSQGAVCLGAFQGDEFVGYLWLCFGRYEEDEVRCTYELSPASTAVFDFDFYLFPEYRAGLAFRGLWEGARQYLRGRGISRSFSRLTRYNLASRRAHAHLGWRRVGQALFLRLGTLEVMAATVQPYVAVTWKRAQRVPLALKTSVFDFATDAEGQAAHGQGVSRDGLNK